jgi:thymidylate synthase (FAD)
MRIKLIAHTEIVSNLPGYEPHPYGLGEGITTDVDELPEQAGRLCYLSWMRPNPKTRTNRGYLANILFKQHYSVLEHSTATIYIDGVTRNFTHELVRHRHFSYSELSQRYVDASGLGFVEHPGLASIDEEERKRLKQSVTTAFNVYGSIVHDLIRKGKDRKKARQAARHSLPSGTETKILVTGNMRTWREMLSKRLSPEADEEFQQVAALILAEMKRIAPNTFQDFD